MGNCRQKMDPNIRGTRRKHNTNPKDQGLNKRPQPHIGHSMIIPHPPMVVDSCPCIKSVKHYQISLTKVLGIKWMQKCSGFSMHAAYQSMFFTLPYWHEMIEAIQTTPKGNKGPKYDKARTVGLDKEKAKIQNALGQFTNAWKNMGYPLYHMVGRM